MFCEVKDVKYLKDYSLHLRFNDGVEGDVDLMPHLKGEVFEPLKDQALFSKVSLDSYSTIQWPNGADLAPEFLYKLVTGKYPDYVRH